MLRVATCTHHFSQACAAADENLMEVYHFL